MSVHLWLSSTLSLRQFKNHHGADGWCSQNQSKRYLVKYATELPERKR